MFVLAFLFSSSLYAQLAEPYVGVRPAGMGNAFTAVANDDSSVWTNPAGVARVRKARARTMFHLIKIPNVIFGSNPSGKTFFSGLRSSSDGGVDEIAASGASAEHPVWVRASAFPVAFYDTSRNSPMATGFYTNSQTQVIIDSDAPTDARIQSVTDTGMSQSIAFSSDSNRINFGLNLRPAYRYAYSDTVPSTEIFDKTALRKRFTDGAAKGFGLGIDAGAMFTVADFWFPTIGLAAFNLPTGCKEDYLNMYTEKRQEVCGTVYAINKNGQDDTPAAVDPTDLRVGVSITPRITRAMNLRFSIDAHHLYLNSGTKYYGLPGADAGKLFHAGVEFFWGNPLLPMPVFSARVGSNQNLMTYGVSLNLGALSLDFASYAVDISPTSAPQEDRRSLFGLSLYF